MPDDYKPFGDGSGYAPGLISDRQAQPLDKVQLPKDLVLVSADNHIEITDDIFYQAFPARLKDKAPRVWFDHFWHIGFREEFEAYPIGINMEQALEKSLLNDGFSFDVRNRHLDQEGVAKEIAYPQSLMAFIRYPDPEVQELLYRTYNEYLAKLDGENQGRFHGVGICSNWWDPQRIEASVQQIVDLGLKTYMVPIVPGKGLDGKALDYSGPEMDRFWAVVAEAGLPLSFHIGEVPTSNGRGGFGTWFMVQASPFRRVLGNLIFGGILDRHPTLKIVFAEAGINWAAGALQDAEMTYGAHGGIFDKLPKHRPSHYWHQNCYATFQTDPIGLRLLDYLGADRVMWSQDYPHSEGTFGYTSVALKEVWAAAGSEANARKILGGNAASVYKLT
jgi:predicted TIM-barrel fold metal-dependent hydrolase